MGEIKKKRIYKKKAKNAGAADNALAKQKSKVTSPVPIASAAPVT